MADKILIVGETGRGKSTSIKTLDPKHTFLINVENKSLPWKGFKKDYQAITKEFPAGNMFSTDNSEAIIKLMDKVDKEMPEITTIVIDDYSVVIVKYCESGKALSKVTLIQAIQECIEGSTTRYSNLEQEKYPRVQYIRNSNEEIV